LNPPFVVDSFSIIVKPPGRLDFSNSETLSNYSQYHI